MTRLSVHVKNHDSKRCQRRTVPTTHAIKQNIKKGEKMCRKISTFTRHAAIRLSNLTFSFFVPVFLFSVFFSQKINGLGGHRRKRMRLPYQRDAGQVS